jgi:excisionase family DNA binding protein
MHLEDAIAPSEADVAQAKASVRKLAAHGKRTLCLRGASSEETIELPAIAVDLLMDLLRQLAAGNAVTLIPIHAELTTQNAADLLGVSRPFLVKQLEDGALPFRKVGRHRRVLFKDLMAYKQAMNNDRRAALDALSKQAQDLDMGY